MEPFFELADYQSGGLSRIRALRDIPMHGVRAGDYGGWVSSTHTSAGQPRIAPTAWLGGDATLCGEARLLDHALVKGRAVIQGHAFVCEGAIVRGQATVADNARITGRACVQGTATITDHALIDGRAHIHGSARIGDHATITERAKVFGDAVVSDNAYIAGFAEIAARNHYLVIQNFPSFEGQSITVYRDRNGNAIIRHGNSENSLDQLRENNESQIRQLVNLLETLTSRWAN